MLSEYRIFFREFRRQYRTTGAISPSGRWLANSMTRFVREGGSPRKILEVGPGTGAVTKQIVQLIRPGDQLDLVELNESFVRALQHRLATEPVFQKVSSQIRILHKSVEDLPLQEKYDCIISGLPLNNFAVDDVQRILQHLKGLLKTGGTLSFFQYIAIRSIKGVFSSRKDRQRLQGIGLLMNELLQGREIRRDWIWPNFPPAWVHHVRMEMDK